jgi:hypothetical protein
MGLEARNYGFYVEKVWFCDGKLWRFMWCYSAAERSADGE